MIFCVAPPSLEIRSDTNKLVTVPKSRAINNWASLSVGLLKKLNKQYEDVLYIKKREYLLERENYLDKQLDGYVNKDRFDNERDVDLMLCIKNQEDSTSDASPPTSPLTKSPSKMLKRKISNATPKRIVKESDSGDKNFTDFVIEPSASEDCNTSNTFYDTQSACYNKDSHKKVVTTKDEILGTRLTTKERKTPEHHTRHIASKISKPRLIDDKKAELRTNPPAKRIHSSKPTPAKDRRLSECKQRPMTAARSRKSPELVQRPMTTKEKMLRKSKSKCISRVGSAATVPRPESVKSQSDRRPRSAMPHQIYIQPSVNNLTQYHSQERMMQLDNLERELRKTTIALQKKLSIHKSSIVK